MFQLQRYSFKKLNLHNLTLWVFHESKSPETPGMWYEAAPAIRKMWVQFLYLVVIGSLVKRVFNSSVWLKTWFSSFNSLDKYLNREYTFDKLKITYFYWPLNDIFNSLGATSIPNLSSKVFRRFRFNPLTHSWKCQ